MVVKKAFSMIELIISIVIIGIVAASFPLILTQTSNNVAFAMQQEAILSAKTYMGTILSYPWDSGSIVIDAENNAKVVVLSTGNATFENPGDILRKGHIDQPYRRTMAQDAAGVLVAVGSSLPINLDYVSVNNYQSGTADAVEDLTVVTADNDSVVNIALRSNVNFVEDVGGANYTRSTIDFDFDIANIGAASNIKLITVDATSPDSPNLRITLRAYTSNIGELELKPKGYL
jgi:prepilin-type N-terminal cleavage/methylation domain-containing protein